MAYVAGWDHGATELRVYADTRDVANTFPEVFGEIGEQRTPPREHVLAELVEIANQQWHDHTFVFRLAWSWEIDAATSAPLPVLEGEFYEPCPICGPDHIHCEHEGAK